MTFAGDLPASTLSVQVEARASWVWSQASNVDFMLGSQLSDIVSVLEVKPKVLKALHLLGNTSSFQLLNFKK